MTISDDDYIDREEPYTDDGLSIIDENPDYITCPLCPLCDGIGGLMGSLGNIVWYRCIQCGMDFHI